MYNIQVINLSYDQNSLRGALMKFTEKFLLKSSGYTVVILTLLYIFAMITNLTDASIDFPAFSLVFCFSCVISLSELIFKTDLKFIWKLSIHYHLYGIWKITYGWKLGNIQCNCNIHCILLYLICCHTMYKESLWHYRWKSFKALQK